MSCEIEGEKANILLKNEGGLTAFSLGIKNAFG